MLEYQSACRYSKDIINAKLNKGWKIYQRGQIRSMTERTPNICEVLQRFLQWFCADFLIGDIASNWWGWWIKYQQASLKRIIYVSLISGNLENVAA